MAELRRFHDDGGSFMELGRLSGGLHADFPGFEVKQINYSEMEPGVIKAFHLHRRQTDVWFVPPADKMLLVLLDVREGSRTGTCRAGSCSATARRGWCASRPASPTA